MLNCRFLFLFLLTLFLFYTSTNFAQSQLYSLTELKINDLSAFEKAAPNWQTASGVSGNFNDNLLQILPGTGILANNYTKAIQFKPEANLFTTLQHGDIYFETDFMMPKGSNSGIYFQGRYEIQLFDSWGERKPSSSDCGGIYERWDESRQDGKKGYEGHAPRTNACFAPGLWQHLTVQFQAPKFDASGKKTENARFVKVTLNGIILHENVVLSGPTRAAAFTDEVSKAPIMFQGDHGQVFFRNIQYALLNDFSFKLNNLNYEYYEGKEFTEFSQVKPEQLVRKGKAIQFDSRLADARDNFYLMFSGKFTIDATDRYAFLLSSAGIVSLEVDGKQLIYTKWTQLDSPLLKGETTLSAGEHEIKIQIIKHISWQPKGLGVYVQKSNTKLVPLHTPASLPEPRPLPIIEVQPKTEPELIRSFMMHNNRKKTHVISVGDPLGTHYSYDLNQAGLMQVWKGGFLNTTEMWYERGEPQLAEALGAGVILSGKSPFAIVTDKNTALPDSLNDRTELIYKGYSMDSQRYPVFHYQYLDAEFDDAFAMNQSGKGLTRLLSVKKYPSSGIIMVKLADGNKIESAGGNIYVIGDRKYYIQVIPSKDFKPFVREMNGKKELVAEVVKQPKMPVVVLFNLFW
jgi:hypothetical protein